MFDHGSSEDRPAAATSGHEGAGILGSHRPARAAFAAAGLGLALGIAFTPDARAEAAAPAAAAKSAAGPVASERHASAFDGYRRFEEQPLVPWREANETVQRIGGWRAYAREAAADDRGTTAARPPGHASVKDAPVSRAPAHPHAGHGVRPEARP